MVRIRFSSYCIRPYNQHLDVRYVARQLCIHEPLHAYRLYPRRRFFTLERQVELFPLCRIGLDLKQESFLKDNSFIDQLKLRLGYGSVGNQAVEAYRIYSKMAPVTVTNASGNSATAYKIDRPAASFLKWERNDQFNVGVDFGILNGRIRLTADWYSKLSKDILLEVARPSHMGYTSILDKRGRNQKHRC